ncbi:MAG: hypothetical protein WBB39_02610 [Candidatus Saccharimonadales bacterium]
MNRSSQTGDINPLLLSNIVTAIIAIVLVGITVWAYSNYIDQKDNVNKKISAAVDEARVEQEKKDNARFVEQEKVPTREFVGPDDTGRVSFQYPKTWSVYVAKNINGLEAYLNPSVVPPIIDTQPFAVRVIIVSQAYESVLKSYEALIKKGDLRSAPYSIRGFSGIRLDGRFTKDREGSAVVFKIRDKTLTMFCDSKKYLTDFDNTVMKTINFNL